jgi:hypothetical protein
MMCHPCVSAAATWTWWPAGAELRAVPPLHHPGALEDSVLPCTLAVHFGSCACVCAGACDRALSFRRQPVKATYSACASLFPASVRQCATAFSSS